MPYTEQQTFGFAEAVIGLLRKEQKALTAAKLDVNYMIANLDNTLTEAVNANENQEALKRQTKAATKYFVALKRRLYVTSSGYLDMAIAGVDKDSDAAKSFRRVRTGYRRRRTREEEAETTE